MSASTRSTCFCFGYLRGSSAQQKSCSIIILRLFNFGVFEGEFIATRSNLYYPRFLLDSSVVDMRRFLVEFHVHRRTVKHHCYCCHHEVYFSACCSLHLPSFNCQ